jgi:hypothetical protein
MKWNTANVDPIRQDTYLCYGDKYTPLNDEEGVYYIAKFVFDPISGPHWFEDVPNYHDMILKYWCELPEKPK